MSRVAGAYGQNRVPSTDTKKQGLSDSPGVYIGTVKKNDDPQNMGRLQVYIESFGGKPDDPMNWISVSYASPFAGTTSIFEQGANVEEYADTMKSYGFWAVPPDIDNKVLIAFADGKLDLGYWFACLFSRNTQISIPGLPAKNTHKGEKRPAAPKNKKDKDTDLEKYVEHTPMYNALKQQGLEEDTTRGLTTSSAMRESPSRVIGLLTPGQHQFVMDDGDKDGHNKLIRLRTVNGVQLLLDDESGHIYMISKTGNSWVEISSDGQIHLYGSNDINIRSEANINLHADKNVNIEAGEAITLAAAKDITLQSGANMQLIAKSDTMITSGQTSHISSSAGHYETAAVIHMNGPAATAATAVENNTLIVNTSVTDSICTTVPEHEPWAGHAGTMNPIGPGNQQMKGDPAPEQNPRQPEEGEQGTPIDPSKQDKAEEVPVETAKASEDAVSVIKEENGYTPVNVDDADGQSVGFGSELITDESTADDQPQQNLTSAGIGEEAAPSVFLSEAELSPPELTQTADGLTAATTTGFNTGSLPNVNEFGQSANKNLLDKIKNTGTNASSLMPNEGNSFINKLSQSSNLSKVTGSLPTNPMGSLNQTGLGGISAGLAAGLGIGAATAGLKSKLPNTIPGQNYIPNDMSNILSSGVTGEKANQMLLNDITKSEKSVKTMLSGVDKVPQNVFDGLVSFHNQTGDASYAFVKGEKIDLTGMYKNKEWDRAAGFIAADDRDRSRRIREATMMSSNSYGNIVSEQSIINQGLQKTNELIGKGKLNQQTGNSPSWQQTVAAGASYFAQTGSAMPSLNTVTKLNIADKMNSGSMLGALKRQSGPWPY